MSSYQTPQDEGYSEDPLTTQLSGPLGRDSMDSLIMQQSVADRTRKSSA